jgi:serine/threonine protein phosphatase PrpC
MKPILLTAAGNPENQDRGLVLHDGARVLLCVADGAGGQSGGREAARMAVEEIRKNVALMHNSETCAKVLREMDATMAEDALAGESTCALAIVTQDEIFGASVGDSGVWIIPEGETHVDLSGAQQRKPFIGSGSAWPTPFQLPRRIGRLLLATDGLLKYASAESIVMTIREHPIELAPHKLIELVRYPSGVLPDDVTLILTAL